MRCGQRVVAVKRNHVRRLELKSAIGEILSAATNRPPKRLMSAAVSDLTSRAQVKTFFRELERKIGLAFGLELPVARIIGVIGLIEEVPGVDAAYHLETGRSLPGCSP